MKTNDKNSVGYLKSIPNNLDSGAPIQDTIWKVVKRWKSQFIVSGAVVVLAILTFLEHRLDLSHFFTGTPPSPFNRTQVAFDLVTLFLVGFASVFMLSAVQSKRKKAEEALKESEEKYKALIEAAGRAGEGIIIIQDSGEGEAVFVFVNDQFCRMSDHSREELIARSPWDLVPPEISTRLKDWYKRRHTGEPLPTHYEAAGVRKDGTVVPLELSIVTMPWQGKIATVLYLRDITERKKAEETLRESEEQFRQLAENIDQVFWLTDWENNKLLYVNASYEKLFDRSCQSAYEDRLSWYKVMHPDDRARVRESLVKNAKLGQSTEVEYRIVRDDGTMRWILDRNYPIYDKHGKVYRIVSIAEDITERKRTEEALRESEEKYRELAESITDIFFAMDKDLRYTYWNKASENLTGVSAQDALGKSLDDIFPDTPQTKKAEQVYLNVLRTKEPQTFVNEHHLGGKDFVFEISAYPSKDGLSVFVKDITERKKAEEQVLRQSALLEAINEVLRETLTCETDEEVARTCLAVAEKLTGSKFVWIGELNPDGCLDAIAISDPGWDACRMPKSDAAVMLKNMEIHGIWGKVLREEKSLIVDDPASHPDRIGIPEGHPPLTSFLGVPLKRAGKTIGMIALANKESGYDLADQEAIKTLSVAFMEALDRKRAEEALRESEYNYRSLMEQASDGIFISYGQGNYIDVNRAACKMLGYTQDELLHLSTSRIVHSEDLAAQPLRWDELRTGEAILIERRLIRKDGTTIPVGITAKMLEDGRFQALVRDITERKQAEEALQESEGRYRNLFENAPIGIYRTTPDGRILMANPTLIRMLGYSSFEELASRNLEKEGYEASYPRSQFKQLLESKGEVRGLEAIWIKKDKSFVFVRENAKVVRDHDGAVLYYEGTAEDITERKQVEEALSLSEQRLKRAQAIAHIGGWDWNIEENTLSWSDELYRIFGVDRRTFELSYESIESLIHPEDRDLNRRHVKELLESSNSGEYTFRIVRPDGEVRHVNQIFEVVRDDEGEAIRAFGTMQDITERKQAEEALQFIRFAVDNAGDTMVCVSQDAHLIDVNDAFCRSVGYSREELLAMTVHDIDPNYSAKIWPEFWEKLKQSGSLTFESCHRTKDGKGFPVEVTVTFFKYKGKEYHCGFARDITERKRAEEAIRESEEKYRGVVENIGIGVSLISPNMEIMTLNHQMNKWFPNIDISKKPICYHAFNNLPREKVCSYCPTFKTLQDGLVHESITETPLDNKIINYRVVSSPIKDKSGKIIAAIEMVEDITEKKKMETQLIQAERLSAVGTLAYGIAHEFNNILAGILGNAEFGMGNDDPQEMKECFQIIMESCDRAKSITNSLLAFSRQRETKKQRADVTSAVETVLGLVERELEKHKDSAEIQSHSRDNLRFR